MTQQKHDIPELLTPDDVAEKVKVARKTVIKWAQEGYLPAPLIDQYRTKRWSPQQIEDWMRSGER